MKGMIVMDREMKLNFLLDGMVSKYKKTKQPLLLNKIIGLKFKSIRLKKNITAEAVVQDNSSVLSSTHSLYKFELGATTVKKLFALSKYYKTSVDDIIKQLN
jgi:hypothetical protein|tara:strand:+ start:512 stop:817 length:306 start_codon:yes stop_codon:yes gene_type:complete